MKKLVATIAIVLMLAGSSAFAAMTTFNFDDGSLGIYPTAPYSSTAIGNYMTDKYGSSVTVIGAQVISDDSFNNTKQMSTRYGVVGSMSIYFNDAPVNSVAFDWRVFANPFTMDFSYRAYDTDNNIVDSFDIYDGASWDGYYDSGNLTTAATHIWIADTNIHDVGIDNLVVNLDYTQGGSESYIGGNEGIAAVPAPGAMLLAGLGSGLAGWLKRRKMI